MTCSVGSCILNLLNLHGSLVSNTPSTLISFSQRCKLQIVELVLMGFHHLGCLLLGIAAGIGGKRIRGCSGRQGATAAVDWVIRYWNQASVRVASFSLAGVGLRLPKLLSPDSWPVGYVWRWWMCYGGEEVIGREVRVVRLVGMPKEVVVVGGKNHYGHENKYEHFSWYNHDHEKYEYGKAKSTAVGGARLSNLVEGEQKGRRGSSPSLLEVLSSLVMTGISSSA
ncbi:hypothetical protein Droror1_Dr00024132 [Drosera rotundifolia]